MAARPSCGGRESQYARASLPAAWQALVVTCRTRWSLNSIAASIALLIGRHGRDRARNREGVRFHFARDAGGACPKWDLTPRLPAWSDGIALEGA